jgi:hypothetical protein
MSKPDEVGHIVNDARATVLVTTDALLENLPSRADIPTPLAINDPSPRAQDISGASKAAPADSLVRVDGAGHDVTDEVRQVPLLHEPFQLACSYEVVDRLVDELVQSAVAFS